MNVRAVSRLRTQGIIAFCVSTLLAGCGGGGGGYNNNNTPPPASQNPPPATTNSLFQQVQTQVLTPNCTGCHVGAGAPQGLRLDAANSFAMLVNVASTEMPTLLRVKPGDPDNSWLVQKIDGRATIGGRMPLGRAPLPQASIDLVRSWIAAGATMNSADDGRFSIQSTVPAADELSVAPVKEFQIIFSSDIDASLVASAAISIEASGGDGSFTDGNEAILPLADVQVSPANPRVLLIHPAAPLAGDDYRLVIDQSSGISLADNANRTLDGDGDGQAGGAFTLTFHGVALDAR